MGRLKAIGLRMAMVTILGIGAALNASAQLDSNKDAGVRISGYYLNVTSIAEHEKFWVDTLGGKPLKFGKDKVNVVEFPDIFIFLHVQKPTSGSKGSPVDHVGFSVRDLRAVLDKVKAGGFRVVTAQEASPNITVKDDIGQANAGGVTGIAFVMGPDEVKVELLERKAQTGPIMADHVHFFGPQQAEMRDWYIKVFGATAQTSASPAFTQAILPGIALNFTQARGPVAGTKGRAIDHIGFEVTNLDEFAKRLQTMGISTAVRNMPASNTKVAFITDPWGTLIELSEGLRQF